MAERVGRPDGCRSPAHSRRLAPGRRVARDEDREDAEDAAGTDLRSPAFTRARKSLRR